MTRPATLLMALLVAACQPSAIATPTPAGVAQPTLATSPAASGAGTSAPATHVSPPAATSAPGSLAFTVQTFPVASGAHPHDVAIASDGGIWYTGQQDGTLG